MLSIAVEMTYTTLNYAVVVVSTNRARLVAELRSVPQWNLCPRVREGMDRVDQEATGSPELELKKAALTPRHHWQTGRLI